MMKIRATGIDKGAKICKSITGWSERWDGIGGFKLKAHACSICRVEATTIDNYHGHRHSFVGFVIQGYYRFW